MYKREHSYTNEILTLLLILSCRLYRCLNNT